MREFLLAGDVPEPDYENAVQALDLTGEGADQTFDALSSPTSRGILEILYEDPMTPPEMADEMSTSSQNIHYHLGKLESADLIEPTGTAYSSRGTEMDIYAPTSEAIVLLTGREGKTEQIRNLLQRFLAGLGIISIVSLLLQFGFGIFTSHGAAGVAHGASPSVDPWYMQSGALGIPPGLLVFLVGLLVLGVEIWLDYRNTHGP